MAPEHGPQKIHWRSIHPDPADHVWSIAEICNLLPESHTIAAQIDKALVLKALGEKPTSLWKS